MEKKLDEEQEKEKERIMKYLRDQTVPKAKLRSDALEQIYKKNRQLLEGFDGICYLNQQEVESITNGGLEQTHFDTRDGSFVLNDNKEIAMLAWSMSDQECERKFAKFFMDKTWKKKFGKIRDQAYHLLCWGYNANDLISASLRRRHNKKFVPISVWHLCAYCKPWLLGQDPDEEHHCYGGTSENGILHTQHNGGYKEKKEEKYFDCKNHFPPRDGVGEPFIGPGLVKPRLIKTLEDALEELKKQPVGADLLHYDGLILNDKDGVRVYEGPIKRQSVFQGYHSVTMVGVTRIKGKLVVICRLSNGSLAGHHGYVYVSLATLYIPVGVTLEGRELVHGYSTPRPLLSNFVVAERIVKEGEDDVDEDEDEDEDADDVDEDEDDGNENEDLYDDWEPEDEKEEDEREQANLKKIRLSSLPGYGYGSWSCSLATATSKKLTLKKGHPEEEEDSMESGPKDGIKTAETKMVSYSVGDTEELNLKEESWVSIPNQILKTLQTIREITGKQHSDEDIYAVYIECFNDPNETAQKLLSLDTFHEVKNERDEKKENVTQGSSRNGGTIFPNQGYGRNASFRENHVAGGFRASRPVSNRGRNFVGPRTNRVSGPSGVGNGKAEVDVAASVEKGVVEEHPPAKASFASVISAEPKPAAKAMAEAEAKALEPVVNNEPKKLQPFTFGRQDTWEQVTENGTASNEGKDQSGLRADVGERANVTFPFHIQAAKKLQNGLTFGSFGSNFVKEVSSNISASGGDESFESSHETGDDEEEDSSPATNGIPEVVSAREGASSFSDGKDQGDSHSTSENDQIVQPVEQALTNTEAHQIVYGHGAPLSMFGLVPSMPALGQPVNTEGAETQNGTPNASLATYPQQDQLFRQQYQPFFMPPPYIHQYMAPNGIPQLSQTNACRTRDSYHNLNLAKIPFS